MTQSCSNELEENILNILKNKLDLVIPTETVKRVFRLGNIHAANRPVIMKFTNFKYRGFILKKEVDCNNSGFAVSPSYTKEEVQQRSGFKKFLKQAKEVGTKVQMTHNKLYVDKKHTQ